MNNNFKANRLKPSLAVQSFYQCPIPGGAVGQNMYNPFQSNSTKGNNIRFPTNIVPSQQKEQMISTQRQYNPVQGSSRIMRSSTEFCGFPYFLDAPDNVHVYSEHQSFAMQDYSSLPEMDSAYRCQYEDVTAGKEKCYQGFQSNKQFKSTNSTSLPKTSSQQVRFNLSKKQTTSNIPHSKMTDTVSLKTSKRWEDDSRPLRVLTGSIDKIIKWEKIIETSVVLFEVVATLVAVRPGAFCCEKVLLLRDEATPALQCLFYTIDRPLPPVEKGQLIRCVGEMLSKHKLKVYSVRPASVAEQSGLQRLSFASQRAVTALELAIPEP